MFAKHFPTQLHNYKHAQTRTQRKAADKSACKALTLLTEKKKKKKTSALLPHCDFLVSEFCLSLHNILTFSFSLAIYLKMYTVNSYNVL